MLISHIQCITIYLFQKQISFIIVVVVPVEANFGQFWRQWIEAHTPKVELLIMKLPVFHNNQ